MAVAPITASTLPRLIVPRNWEEVEQAFASLQAWLGNLSGDLADLRASVGQLNVASSHVLSVGDLAWSSTRFQKLGGGTWTVEQGDMDYLRYVVVGQLVIVFWRVETTAIAGADLDQLYIDLPEFISLPEPRGGGPTYGGGTLQWSDPANSDNGIGIASVSGYGAQFGVPARTQINLDKVDVTATTPTTRPWLISSSLSMSGSIAFLIKSSTIPGLGI